MADFLSDPRYLGPIATSCGIAVSLVLWILNLRTKELSYEITARTPLISVKEEVQDKIQISFQGQPVDDVHLVVIKIANSGNVPIRSSEFEGKFAITLAGDMNVLLAEVLETKPASLLERCRVDDNIVPLIAGVNKGEVPLRPLLLNPRDSITIKMLVSPAPNSVQLGAHIEGIASIKQARERSLVPIVLTNVGSFIMAVSLFFLEPSALMSNAMFQYLPYLVFFLLGYVMLLSGVYFPRINRNSIRRALGLAR